MRQGDIRANEPMPRETLDEAGKILRRDRRQFISPRDVELLQPKAVDQGRARMRDRPANDTSF